MSMLTDKVVWVIGGGSGIGRAVALAAAKEGAIVYVSGRRVAALEETVNLAESSGTSMVKRPLDAANLPLLQAQIAEIVSEHGRLDSLVVSVGQAKTGTIESTTLDEWHQMLTGHLDVPFMACKAAVSALRASNDGNILLMGSVFGLRGRKERLAYCTAKGGLVNFTRALALDLAGGVRVNSVCPGWVRTPMSMALVNAALDPTAAMTERNAWHPMNRGGDPEEVAALAVFLMSKHSSWTTGQNLPIDGGYTAR